MIPLTSVEIQHIAEVSANKAVRELLIAMGVDANDPEALLEMQRDFAHLRDWRKSVAMVKNKTLTAAIGILVTGVAGAIWLAVRGPN
jgi:hypothetical protein